MSPLLSAGELPTTSLTTSRPSGFFADTSEVLFAAQVQRRAGPHLPLGAGLPHAQGSDSSDALRCTQHILVVMRALRAMTTQHSILGDLFTLVLSVLVYNT